MSSGQPGEKLKSRGKPASASLTEVTSIDRDGEEALSEIMSHGGEFIASDVYTKHLLQNLRRDLEQSRVKQDDGGNQP